MKILFICGCLEHGHDGVGDYSRCLAAELIRQGHTCQLIALNDQFMKQSCEEIQLYEGFSIPMLRLSSHQSWSSRNEEARQWVESFQPDWISLQFVPYAFHVKGLPFFLSQRLHNICRGFRLHIMFHELWVGGELGASIRMRIIGEMQKLLIMAITTQCRPHQISTSNLLYQEWLRKFHLNASILPLFGNIPIPANSSSISLRSITSIVRIGVFGSVESKDIAMQLGNWLRSITSSLNITIEFHLIGSLRGEGADTYREIYPEYIESGFLTNSDLLNYLQQMNLILAGTSVYRIGKSGAAALVSELGIPLVVGNKGWQPRIPVSFNINLPAGIYLATESLDFKKIIKFQQDIQPRLATVAKTFTQQLSRSCSITQKS